MFGTNTMNAPYPPQTPAAAPTCYRHPDRQTYVQCTRCGHYMCPDCMRSAAVGHQCVDCVAAGAKSVRRARTTFGGVQHATTPVLTYTLIALNAVVFVLQKTVPGLQRELVLWAPAVAGGDYYRLITSAFMHFGIVHILFNMWALYVIGPPLEQHLGRLRFGTLYLLSALGGSVLVYLAAPIGAATAGASGAVFGLFGATFVVARRLNLDIRWLIILIAANLVITFTVPGVSWQGHVGGLVTGALIAAAYVYPPKERRTAVQLGVSVAALVIFAGLIVWRTAGLIDYYGALVTG